MNALILKIKKKHGKMLKPIIRKGFRIIGNIFRIIGNISRIFEKNPCVIMYMEGGLSSQILRYCKGMWFQEHGMNVKYDLTWYKKKGMDDLGIEERPWRLSKCFPDLKLEIASDKEVYRYRPLYGSDVHDLVNKYKGKESMMKPPLYVALYDFDYLISDFQMCTKYFNWEKLREILSVQAEKTAREIEQYKQAGKKVIGVHVRRGDMTIVGGYWKVLTAKYFEEAIKKVATKESVLYFFSNGFDFVKEEILPIVNYESNLVDNHNEDYEDMYLYSLCDVQVASQGSWGAMAFAFNKNPERKIVIPCTEKSLCVDTLDKERIYIFLEDDMYLHN